MNKQNRNMKTKRNGLMRISRASRTVAALCALLVVALLSNHAQAQPTDFNFKKTPNVRQDLRRYFDEADKKKDAAEWQRIIDSGKTLSAAEWELGADREIEQKLKDAPADQKETLKLGYENEKKTARAAWEQEVDRNIDERRGEWRARLNSEPLLPLLDQIKLDDIRTAVAAADALNFDDTVNIDARIAAFDAAAAPVTALRAQWELGLDAGITTLRDSGSALTGGERTAFLTEVTRIEDEYRRLYQYEEYQELGRGRQKFVRRENRSADINRTIADETDPKELVRLLIERVSRNVDPVTGQLLRDDGSGGTLVVGYDSGGSDTQLRMAAALENGRKQWQQAIDELILKKLKFDREAADKRSEGNQEWAQAYDQILEARGQWLNTINTQIQAGLSQWDASQADLAENKRKALEQLDRFTQTSRNAYDAHARGLEQMVLGGSDTLGTIVENIRWFQEALQRPDIAGNTAVRTTYQAQLTYWQGLETRYRNVVVAAQDVVHNQDMQGVGGVGLLDDTGPNNVLTAAGFDLKIANKEKELLEQRLERAKAVYDYAINNAKETPAEVETRLDAAKTAHTTAEQCYLKRLAELNGGDASVYTCANPGGGGSDLSGGVDTAGKELEEKRTALELARKNLDESRKRYDEILKLQVLAQNPELIKYIGDQSIPVYENGQPVLDANGDVVRVSSLRDEVDNTMVELGLVREKVRQNEAKVFGVLYEKQNALRSLDFYHDVVARINNFETTKEQYAEIKVALGAPGDLAAKIDALLAGDLLVRLYGNDAGAAARKQLEDFKTRLGTADQPVSDATTELSASLDPMDVEQKALRDRLAVVTTAPDDFAANLDGLVNGLESLNAPEPDDLYYRTGELKAVRDAYKTLAAERGGKIAALETERGEYEAALMAFKAYAAANAGAEATAAYQAQVAKLIKAEISYRGALADLEQHALSMQSARDTLDAMARNTMAAAEKFIDGTRTNEGRTTALASIANWKSTHNTAATSLKALLDGDAQAIEKLAGKIKIYSEQASARATALAERSKLFTDVNDVMHGMSADFAERIRAGRAELAFLLDETGSTAGMDTLVDALELEEKQKGAALNLAAADHLKSLFPAGATRTDRDLGVILDALREDIDARARTFNGDAAAREALQARRAVFAYLAGNAPSFVYGLDDDTRYQDLVDSLGKVRDDADVLNSFYQSGSKYSDADRLRIKGSGTEQERLLLADSFQYGSGFLFAGDVGREGGPGANTAANLRAFASDVKAGRVLTVLADVNFRSQEGGGLLGEIKTSLQNAGLDITNLDADALYKDGDQDPANLTIDAAATTALKAKLTTLLAGASTDAQKLDALLDSANGTVFAEIFGNTASLVHGQLSDVRSRLQAANGEITTLSSQFIAGAGNLATAVAPVLAELTDAKKTPYTNLEATYALIPDLKNIQDAAFPLYDGGGAYIGDDKPLKNLDLTTFNTTRTAFTTALGDWTAKRDALGTANNEFTAARTAFGAHRTANPGDTTSSAYKNLLGEIRAKATTLATSWNTYREYRTELEKAHGDARGAVDAVLFEIGFILPGVVGLKLMPETAYNALSAAEKTAVDGDPAYRVVRAADPELLRKLADVAHGLNRNISDINTHGTDFNRTGIALTARASATETTLTKLTAAETNLTNAGTDAAALTVGLDGRVVAYANQGGGKVAPARVIEYINGIRDFLYARDLSGKDVNAAIREVLTQATVPADELDSLLFLQGHPAFADLKNGNAAAITAREPASDTELANAKKLREEREAAGEILAELRSVSQALKDQDRPLSADSERVTALLTRYREFKNQPGMNYTVTAALDNAMTELEERAWQLHRAELVGAFLSNRTSERSPDGFLANLQAGKYYLFGQGNTRVEKKAGFLGEPLNAARLAELTTALRKYNAQTVIASGSVQNDLAGFLDQQDPSLKAELGVYALELAYDDIRENLAAGRAVLGGLPDELTKYAGVETFNAYLKGRGDLDASKAADRVLARTAWLASVYPDQGTADAQALATTLDDYLATYDTRNASFYLPAELKAMHAAEKYYELEYTSRLTPGDLTALNTWLADEKYEGTVASEMTATVRMDYILRNYYGEDSDVYQSEIDAALLGKSGTGLTAKERDGFLLQAAGLADPLGRYRLDPSLALQGSAYLNDFTYTRGLDGLATSLDDELLAFTKATDVARRDERRAKFVNDALKGTISVDTHRNYTGITPDGKLTKVSFEVGVQNRIRELEQQAEQKLGGLLKTLSYESYAYKTAPENATYMSIEKTIAAFKTGYTPGDTVSARTGGDFVFKADLDNLRTRLDSYLNAVQPDFGAANNPDADLRAAQGRRDTLRKSIIEAGSLALQYTRIGDASAMHSELETGRLTLAAFETTFNIAKTEFETAETASKNAQAAYDTKQTETTTAYTATQVADRELARIKAVYDFAQLWSYTGKGDAADKARTGLVEQAKAERDAAQKALDEQNKKITEINARIAKQTTLAELQTAMQARKDVMEKWALRAMRFSRAEYLVKEKVRALKQQIAAKKATVEGLMDQVLPVNIPAGHYRDMDGYLDYGSAKYKASEGILRERYRMLNGIVDGKVGAYDLIFAQHPALRQGGVPVFGQGLADRHPDYDLHSYFRTHGGAPPGLVKDAFEKLNGIWMLFEDPHNQGRVSGSVRAATDTYEQFRVEMNNQVGATVAAQATIFAWMGIYGVAPSIAYINAVNHSNASRDVLEAKVAEVKSEGAQLKALYAQLHELTDIDTVDKLKGVISRKVGGNNEWGLQDSDLALITTTGCASNCALTSLTWKSEKKDLSFNEIAGSDGKSIAHLKAVHDEFGLYTRTGTRAAGNVTSAPAADDATGRGISLMVSMGEFADGMAAMSRTQYEIGRSEYFADAENFVGSKGEKVDQRVLLEDRESFLYALLKKAANEGGTNAGIQYDMYRTIASDYLGQGKAPDQVFELHLAQVRAAQLKDWENKERDFSQRKQEWLTRIQGIRDQGMSQWGEIGASLKNKWQNWTDEFDKQAKAKDAAYLQRIEDAVRKQQEWTASMLQSRSNGGEEQRIKELYASIQGMVAELRKNLPTEIALAINTNEILNKVRARRKNAHRELDMKLLKGALYTDTNVFLTEAKALGFKSTNSEKVLKSFGKLQTELQERGQQFALIQILDGLRSIPETFEKTIAEANQALTREMDMSLSTGGWSKAAGGYARYVKTAASMLKGEPGELQVLPGYAFFQYAKPGLPTIKDSQGRSWNLENMSSSDGSGNTLIDGSGIRAAELDAMVRLARGQMEKDFKKVYDPDNPVNHEINFVGAQGAAGIQGTIKAAEMSARNATGAGFSQGAGGFNANAGFLVGPTEGGAFGAHHFHEFYRIYKLKDIYDKAKAEADELKNDGDFSNATNVGDVVRGGAKLLGRTALYGAAGLTALTSAGLAVGTGPVGYAVLANNRKATRKLESKFNRSLKSGEKRVNRTARDAGRTTTRTLNNMNSSLRSLLLANVGGGAGYWGWEVGKGYKEGGTKGAIANPLGQAASVGSQMLTGTLVNVGLGYTNEGGFSVSADVGFGPEFAKGVGLRVSAGIDYSEHGGFGAAWAGARVGVGDHFTIGGRVYEGGGTSFSLGFNAGLDDGFSMAGLGNFDQLNTSLTYSQVGPGGPTYGLNVGVSDRGRGPRGAVGAGDWRSSLTGGITYNEDAGFGGSVSYSHRMRRGGTQGFGVSFNGSGTSVNYSRGYTGKETLAGLGGAWESVTNALGFSEGGLWDRTGESFGNLFEHGEFATNAEMREDAWKAYWQAQGEDREAVVAYLQQQAEQGGPQIQLTDGSGRTLLSMIGADSAKLQEEKELKAIYWGKFSSTATKDAIKAKYPNPKDPRRIELEKKVAEWNKEYAQIKNTPDGKKYIAHMKEKYGALYRKMNDDVVKFKAVLAKGPTAEKLRNLLKHGEYKTNNQRLFEEVTETYNQKGNLANIIKDAQKTKAKLISDPVRRQRFVDMDAVAAAKCECFVASVYTALKASGANVEDFGTYLAKNIDRGLITQDSSGNFTMQGRRDLLVQNYRINGKEIEYKKLTASTSAGLLRKFKESGAKVGHFRRRVPGHSYVGFKMHNGKIGSADPYHPHRTDPTPSYQRPKYIEIFRPKN